MQLIAPSKAAISGLFFPPQQTKIYSLIEAPPPDNHSDNLVAFVDYGQKA
jgi:hypothetical protein